MNGLFNECRGAGGGGDRASGLLHRQGEREFGGSRVAGAAARHPRDLRLEGDGGHGGGVEGGRHGDWGDQADVAFKAPDAVSGHHPALRFGPEHFPGGNSCGP